MLMKAGPIHRRLCRRLHYPGILVRPSFLWFKTTAGGHKQQDHLACGRDPNRLTSLNSMTPSKSHAVGATLGRTELFSCAMLPVRWCVFGHSASYSKPDSFHNSVCAIHRRQFSMSAAANGESGLSNVTLSSVSGPTSLPLGDAFESSAKAKWASDAATADLSADSPSTVAQTLSDLSVQGDFASLGLGGYSPIGLIQTCLEYLHVQAHLPWWLAIISCTIALRALMFPLAVKVQANAARLNNIRPEMEKLMEKMRRYNRAGNKTMAGQTTAQLLALYQKNKCNPYKMFVMPFIQIPIFVSFFIAIRRMAAVPVESMKTGGLFWFTDLTLPDPYFALPFMACFTFIVTMEVHVKILLECCFEFFIKSFLSLSLSLSLSLTPIPAPFLHSWTHSI